jgi:hypothetical protein
VTAPRNRVAYARGQRIRAEIRAILLEHPPLAPPLTAKALARRVQFAWPGHFSASDIVAACSGIGGEDLRQAIQAAGCSDASSARTVGYWLREHRDRVGGSGKLVQEGRSHGVSRYRLRPME